MCGIAGLMRRDGAPPDPALLDVLERRLRHRGPDSSGRYSRDGCALLSTRLAIIDLDHGQQPLHGPGETTLVANGEIYNNPELRAELAGATFHTGSDCEPPLHLYARLGTAYTARLRGMYAIALHDRARRRLLLSRDPFGIKPLYYVETVEGFAFASEIQALLACGAAPRAVGPLQRAELLQLKFTTGAETIVPGIYRVLPGETLVIEAGRIVARHHQPALPAAPPLDLAPDAVQPALERALLESVAVHLRADVPYGLFLSGGIDSAALLALMQRAGGGRVLALSVGYEAGAGGDESAEAARVAALVGAEFQRLEMRAADFWALAPRIAAALDDPTADAAVLPSFMLGAAARQAGLKVTLCGEGADELFAGYARYRRGRAPWRWVQGRPRSHGVFDTAGAAIAARLGPWRAGLGVAERRVADADWSALQRLQAVDCAEWLPNDLLGKLDRCLMAHGVEGRTPFVDPVLAALAFRLPDAEKIGLRLGKLALRRYLAGALPGARPFARKKGFNPPVGRWMAAQAARLASLVAAQPGIAEIGVPASAIAAIFAQAGTRAQPAWSLLFYALWHSHHILGQPSEDDIEAVLVASAA